MERVNMQLRRRQAVFEQQGARLWHGMFGAGHINPVMGQVGVLSDDALGAEKLPDLGIRKGTAPLSFIQ
jgi:hypothetical protein